MAFLTDKTLFVHVQKTGGMTVRRVLYGCRPTGRESGDAEGERHYGLPELRASHPGIENGRISFGFVRHPVGWLRSRWAFAKMTGLPAHITHGHKAAATWMAACWDEDFEAFAEKYLERYPGVATQTMFRMLGLWSTKPVDRIGKTESLMEDLQDILGDAGEVFDAAAAPLVNGSRAVDFEIPTRLQSRVMAAEPALCARFSYDGPIRPGRKP